MFSARRGVSGDDCMRAAFPADSPRGLTEALAALERAHPSAAVAVLVASLNPYHWRSSRSAVGGLREQGRAALRAAPAVAGWVELSGGHRPAPRPEGGRHHPPVPPQRPRCGAGRGGPGGPTRPAGTVTP